MTELPMPSEVRNDPPAQPGAGGALEPPSVKLVVRLFLIPLLIVGAAVGVMFLISLMAGGTPTTKQALAGLRGEGGGRTAEWLLGPGAKQRYMWAKTLVDQMKGGMSEAQRISLARELIDVLQNHTRDGEGDIRNLLLLALARTWQRDHSQPPMNSPAAVESRKSVVRVLLQYAESRDLSARKAAVLATALLAGTDEIRAAIPTLAEKVTDANEELDVRIAAATALGPIATPQDTAALDALRAALRQDDARNVELEWSAALSLAQLGEADVAPIILKLLSREELAGMQYYDRESDPQNPRFRSLSDQEQQRILINTMLGARNLDVPEVQAKLQDLAQNDPSPRVRAAGVEVLEGAAGVER